MRSTNAEGGMLPDCTFRADLQQTYKARKKTLECLVTGVTFVKDTKVFDCVVYVCQICVPVQSGNVPPLHECIINSLNRLIEIIILYADDNVQFAGTLVNHSDIYICICQCTE